MSAIPVLISRCLLGFVCRYDGIAKPSILPRLGELPEISWIPICPEAEGGLPIPRPPCEIEPGAAATDVLAGNGRVLTKVGRDCTREYCRGARLALLRAEAAGAKFALLKARSPSCGTRSVYDGTFSRTLIRGRGITAELLAGAGITLFSEEELESFSRTLSSSRPESDYPLE